MPYSIFDLQVIQVKSLHKLPLYFNGMLFKEDTAKLTLLQVATGRS
jgi:hypothetical protein